MEKIFIIMSGYKQKSIKQKKTQQAIQRRQFIWPTLGSLSRWEPYVE